MTLLPKLGINGRRGAMLLLLAVIYFGLGASYVLLDPSHSRAIALHWIDVVAPIQYLGYMWFASAALGVLCAFAREPRDRAGFVAAATVPFFWGSLFLIAWITHDSRTGWISTILYWAVSGLVLTASGMRNPLPPQVPGHVPEHKP
jgi:hypothetical protein